MSDYLKRAFRTQLTSTMDAVLKRAVIEIMTVFENSIHDHQMELAQKGEEVVQLKIKLQTAELKLRELECEGERGLEIKKTQTNEAQRQHEEVQNTLGQTSDVPEIDFEVPDDWCVPLGSETVTKKDEDICPSVRLRPLSIPLWHIPVIKQEVATYRVDSHRQIKGVRRSTRGSSIEKPKQSQDGSLQQGQGPRRHCVRNDMKKLLEELKQEYSGVSGPRRGKNLLGKDQENAKETRRKERKLRIDSAELETRKSDDEEEYTCKFCNKVFDTPLGRNVHARSHKRCRGCKKELPLPRAQRYHKTNCEKLKLLARESPRTNPQHSQSSAKKTSSPSRKLVFIKKEHSPSSSSCHESFVQTDGCNKRHRCTCCNKKFHDLSRLKDHMRLHAGEKPFTCSACPKKFHIQQALRSHMTRMHKDTVTCSGANGDLAWTKPLEDIEDNREDLIFSSDKTKCTINLNSVQTECGPRSHSMAVQNSKGFICLMCQKCVKTKRQLVEHLRIHTGERPLKCECSAKFRTSAQLYMHKKLCHRLGKYIQCEKCKKTFSVQATYNKHVATCQKTWPLLCKLCGKGFFHKGRLRNHMEHNHS